MTAKVQPIGRSLIRALGITEVEELLASLYFIASAMMFLAGMWVFGWILLAKACIDLIFAVVISAKRKETHRKSLDEEG